MAEAPAREGTGLFIRPKRNERMPRETVFPLSRAVSSPDFPPTAPSVFRSFRPPFYSEPAAKNPGRRGMYPLLPGKRVPYRAMKRIMIQASGWSSKVPSYVPVTAKPASLTNSNVMTYSSPVRLTVMVPSVSATCSPG